MTGRKLSGIFIIGMVAVALLILWAVRTFGQNNTSSQVRGNLDYVVFKDFSGGINTADFQGGLPDNELLSAVNLIYINENLKARAGYQIFDTSVTATNPGAASLRLVKGLTRQYLRDGTKKVYAACSTKVWVSNAGETDFSALSGTIDSANYVEFQNWKDTLYLVDGGTFQKISGTSLVRANIVDSGNVQLVAQFSSNEVSDTIYFKFDIDPKLNAWAIKSGETSPSKNPQFGRVGVGLSIDTNRVLLFADFLSVLQAGDTLKYCACSLKVGAGVNQDTLLFKRNLSSILENVVWTTKPDTPAYNMDTAIIGSGAVSIDLNCSTYVDSIINFGKPNFGFTVLQKDSVLLGGRSITLRRVGSDSTSRAFIKIVRKTKLKNLALRPNVFRDTTKAGIWTSEFGDGGLTGYFVEFPDLVNTSDYTRQIINNKGDSLFFTPRLSTAGIVGKAYRIVALPTSIEKAYPRGADTIRNQIDSVTIESFADSTRRVWVDTQTNITNLLFLGGTYFLKIISGKGVGQYQILSNAASPGGIDYLLIQKSEVQFADSTSRFEIFRRVFPSPKHFAVNKSRFWFSDTLSLGRIWYSEINKPGAVSPLNLYTLGGDPNEGEITYLGGLFVSNYDDPQSPLVAGREEAIYLFFGDTPKTDFPRRVISSLGIASARGVILSEKEMFFNNSRGRFYKFDGQNIEWINRKIEDQIPDSLSNKTAGFLLDRIIYWNVPKSNTSYSYHIDKGVWTGQHTFGFSVANVQNLYKDSIAVVIADYQKGKIYNFGKAAQDLGSSFAVSMQSKFFNLDRPDILKHLTEFVLDYKAVTIGADVIFYAGDNTFPTTSSDSVRLLLTIGNKSDKRYLTGASWGRNFSFKIKSAAAGDFKIGSLAIGLELYPIQGFGQ